MTGEPLPHCQFSVERAYEGAGAAYDCVNRRFFDCTDEGPRACAPSTCATSEPTSARRLHRTTTRSRVAFAAHD